MIPYDDDRPVTPRVTNPSFTSIYAGEAGEVWAGVHIAGLETLKSTTKA